MKKFLKKINQIQVFIQNDKNKFKIYLEMPQKITNISFQSEKNKQSIDERHLNFQNININ